ncbi:hypothetical protein O181_121435 [Austropuccinia psidii MF-1]|uniref:Uncharacterized protein n=1 Tax=Austropuccinia psidii MF-1 TaxID=1389203 RepID=A0A9Q3Q2B6_9BASI|nr:hypothetical protein [Austropuccinia psidii MF-1]
MNLNAIEIRVGKPPSIIDISDELLAKIITRKLSGGYDNLKRIIYETQPLETIKVVSKIDDYIRASYTTAKECNANQLIKSESAYKAQSFLYCSNRMHNPLNKHSIEEFGQLKNKNKQKTTLQEKESKLSKQKPRVNVRRKLLFVTTTHQG